MLLGLLARPMTTAELLTQVRAAIGLGQRMIADIETLAAELAQVPAGTDSALEALQRLERAGEAGLSAQLERLEDLGLVDSVAISGQDTLWHRLSLA
jgi:hypothetical protein